MLLLHRGLVTDVLKCIWSDIYGGSLSYIVNDECKYSVYDMHIYYMYNVAIFSVFLIGSTWTRVRKTFKIKKVLDSITQKRAAV